MTDWPPGSSRAVRFDHFVEAALYDPERGFYASGTGRAGRRGDFITSVEVGPLFAAVLARALDAWWEELGRPSPFTVVDAGAGTGTLGRGLLAAAPACLAQGRLVLVERAHVLRAQHPHGPNVTSRADLGDEGFAGVIIANELLDNVAFRVIERTATGWSELFVGPGGAEAVPLDADEALPEAVRCAATDVPVGGRLPLQTAAAAWVSGALGRLRQGRLVVFDYAATTQELAGRGEGGWLRTYRGHERGAGPTEFAGQQDITTDVALDQLPPGAEIIDQASFLRRWGIDALVEEGRRLWAERAHLGDLAALAARSRVNEAAALLAPDGLGGFTVLTWAR